MRRRGNILIVAVAAMALAALPALAQDKTPKKNALDIKMKSFKVVKADKNGKLPDNFKPADESKRGDIIYFELTYKNNHKFDVKNVSIVDPIPAGMEYVTDTAEGKGTDITYSIDGGKTYKAPPVMYEKASGKGVKTTVPAPAGMYTHIKWLIKGPVKPGGSGKIGFKVKIK